MIYVLFGGKALANRSSVRLARRMVEFATDGDHPFAQFGGDAARVWALWIEGRIRDQQHQHSVQQDHPAASDEKQYERNDADERDLDVEMPRQTTADAADPCALTVLLQRQ